MIMNQGAALIAVMGPTGSGKTTFINLVSKSALQVGDSLESCTEEVDLATECEVSGRKVHLIDTPGFDDTEKTQADVLVDIASYLEHSYETGRLLTGIIYMHRISDRRMNGIARESFRLFRTICGDSAMKNVVIVTNMWGDVAQAQGEARERELATRNSFFQAALDRGARMLRHSNTIDSAHAIVGQVLGNMPEPLKMQREMVDQHMGIMYTEVGRQLQDEFRLEEREYRFIGEKKGLRGEIRNLTETMHGETQRQRQEVNDLRAANERLEARTR